ncbi:mRNA-decapping enzyme 1A [Trichinella sp. T9]|nr:mRNA-decapping enzyme 1A [Trichinella sp. T9]
MDFNTSTLRMFDKNIEEITDLAPNVVLYIYNPKLSRWTKSDIEGTLFICRRSVKPYYCIVLLNRVHRRNLMEAIDHSLQVVEKDEFLLYKTDGGIIGGLWFYQSSVRKAVYERLGNLIRQHKRELGLPEEPEEVDFPVVAEKKKEISIVEALMRARSKDEFDKLFGRESASSGGTSSSSSAINGEIRVESTRKSRSEAAVQVKHRKEESTREPKTSHRCRGEPIMSTTTTGNEGVVYVKHGKMKSDHRREGRSKQDDSSPGVGHFFDVSNMKSAIEALEDEDVDFEMKDSDRMQSAKQQAVCDMFWMSQGIARQQFQEALLELIQSDHDFVDRIFKAYCKKMISYSKENAA